MENITIERRQRVRQQQQPLQQAEQQFHRQTGDGGAETVPKIETWQSRANAQAQRQVDVL